MYVINGYQSKGVIEETNLPYDNIVFTCFADAWPEKIGLKDTTYFRFGQPTKVVKVPTSVNGGSSSDPTLPSYDDFVNNLPDNNDTLSSYLRTAFDFLPPDILALVLGGVATAIICLIFKR